MDFDLQWLLIGIPLIFAMGWFASRADLRQLKRENRSAPRAYFHGLNLLLNEQHDKAIDAFIEAVQHDPDTTELHFALGNLFRRRGEFERAVRVHQHLLSRGDLSTTERDRAQHALAEDFMKAGLFDRAEQAYKSLVGTPFDTESRLALLNLYERSRDWRAAADTAAALERAGIGSFANRIAHHWCELSLEADARQDHDAAAALLAKAREASPQAARPLILEGQRRARAGDPVAALANFGDLQLRNPAAFALVANDVADAGLAAGRPESARTLLEAAFSAAPSLELLRGMARLDGRPLGESALLIDHLKTHPTLSGAQAVIERPDVVWPDDLGPPVGLAVAKATKPLQRYRCAACGFEAQHYFWQCPGCLTWDSFPPRHVEEL